MITPALTGRLRPDQVLRVGDLSFEVHHGFICVSQGGRLVARVSSVPFEGGYWFNAWPPAEGQAELRKREARPESSEARI